MIQEKERRRIRLQAMGASLLLHAAVFGTLAQTAGLPPVPVPLPSPRQSIAISLADVVPQRPSAPAVTPAASSHVRPAAQPAVPKATPPKPVRRAAPDPKPAAPVAAPRETPVPTPPLKALSSESAPLTEVSVPSEPVQAYSPPAASPALNPAAAPQALSTETTDPEPTVLGRIRGMIEAAVTYPSAARRLRIEGVVRLGFVLAPDGSVVSAEVLRSSGSALLDARALDTLWDLSGAFPSLEAPIHLTIPITFSLRKS